MSSFTKMATRASATIVKNVLAKKTRSIASLSQLSLRSYCLTSHSSVCVSTNSSPVNTKNSVRTKPVGKCIVQCRGQSTLTPRYEIKKHSVANVKVVHSLRNFRQYSTSSSLQVEQDEAISMDDDDEQGAFDRLGISEMVQRKLRARGINYLFPVQYKAYEQSVAGNDVIIQARTGTGKTLSFAIPLVEKLMQQEVNPGRRNPKVIVLTPTRELANQIKEDFQKLSDNVSVLGVYGGVPYRSQIDALQRGRDVVVGTPGRVNDLMEKGNLSLLDVEHVVLDEVDSMLDFGFKEQVEKIIAGCYRKAKKPQTMLYSATVTPWVIKTAKKYLNDDYVYLNFVSDESVKTATTIKQYAMECSADQRAVMVMNLVNQFAGLKGRAIVFTETKKEADQLSTGFLRQISQSLHGDKSQNDRENILQGFKKHSFRILITTSVAARGLDIPDVPLVIQTSPPNNTDHYIHRVGRTGRAGKAGVAICFHEPKAAHEIRELERAANVKFTRLAKPSQSSMGDLALSQALTKLEEVPEHLIEKYREAAEKYIEEKGATEGMAAALIALGDIHKLHDGSLLSGRQGYQTVQYTWHTGSKTIRAIKDEFQNILAREDIGQIEYVKDSKAVVLDVKSNQVSRLISEMEESTEDECIEKLQELPELNTNLQGFGSQRNTWSRNHNNSRSYGNRYDSTSYNRRPYGSRYDSGSYGSSRNSYGQSRDGGMTGRKFSGSRGSFGEGKERYGVRDSYTSNTREFTRRPDFYDIDED